MSAGASAEARSEAELRVITVKTESGDLVNYSGNPAELPGVRYETRRAMKRAGAFTLLIKHNASRLKNGVICTEDLDSVPIVTQVIPDDDVDDYSYEQPCPSTTVRLTNINAARAMRGEALFPGIRSIIDIPDKLLKLAIPNPHEVQVEALAYALTQLSVFEDKQHANELLELCDYDGRKLSVLLDHIEAQSTPEDVTLVTSRRDRYKEAGLKGLPLSFASYRAFFKQFDVFEYKCPPADRLKDRDLMQLVGTLFIKDPEQRKAWSDNLVQPVIYDATGLRLNGPPTNFREAKSLAEKLLRGKAVVAELDEGSSSQTALLAKGILEGCGDEAAKLDALNALVADPRKSISSALSTALKAGEEYKVIDVPKGSDNKYLYWAPPMSQCDCGTPDEGRHIKYKWPCAYYRKPDGEVEGRGGRGGGDGGRGGRGSGAKGKGKKGKGASQRQTANFTGDQLAAIAAAVKAASETASDTASVTSEAPSLRSEAASTKSSIAGNSDKSSGQTSLLANFESDDSELKKLMDSTSLGADLAAWFSGQSGSDSFVLPTKVSEIADKYIAQAHAGIDPLLLRAVGAELQMNSWSHWADYIGCDPFDALVHRRVAEDNLAMSGYRHEPVIFPALGGANLMPLWTAQSTERGVRGPRFVPDALLWFSSGRSNSFGLTYCNDDVQCFDHSMQNCCGPLIQLSCDNADVVPSDGSGSHLAMPALVELGGEHPPSAASTLPIFRSPIDSGCTATCTNDINLLVNVRPCDEEFNVADGKKSKCVAIGDLPVMAKDSHGKIYRFTFSNVRYVPDFKFTLISVGQIWRDQRINSLFADQMALKFSDGTKIPFDARFKACVVTFISEAKLSKSMSAIELQRTRPSEPNLAGVGFHNIKSVAHIARLPIAQASELIHRRCHLGVNKIRALPHVSNDAPKILASAIPGSCVHCATAQIRRASHSSAMDAPAPEPGDLHVDLKGPFPLSTHGKYRYGAFFTDVTVE